MENLSRNKKISLGLGIALIISLFLPWVDVMIFSMSLIGVPGALSDMAGFLGGSMGDMPFKLQLLVYIGYVFLFLELLVYSLTIKVIYKKQNHLIMQWQGTLY